MADAENTETYESLILVETTEHIYIRPSQFTASKERFIIINRDTDEITTSRDQNKIPTNDTLRSIGIAALIGVIKLVGGPYLIIMKSRIRVGEIGLRPHIIWQLNEFELIPFHRSLLYLNEKQARYNQTYLEMINTVLSTQYFYYSHTYDLSHNVQGLDMNPPDFYQRSLIDRGDERFVWNLHALERFRAPEFRKFCIPFIHGFITINPVQISSQRFKLIIISRRSSKRPGTRLFCRGIDSDGNVSNFVETEQIVEYNNDIASFVQVRGSVPLYWTQKPNLKYKPPPTLIQANHEDAFVLHFTDLVIRYNKIVCVNLVNQSGSELVLHNTFQRYIDSTAIENVRYEAFDFHHECRKMQWHRLDILVNRLAPELDEFGYYLLSSGQRKRTQLGVFRTNCVDCLDRTNVVQGLLARRNLEMVLSALNIIRDGDKIMQFPELEYLFKNIWADNGDTCSMEYAGTGALKSDFTRTGKRSPLGIMKDGYNSAIRYFKNNFFDGQRQDAMDLFVGNFNVDEKEGQALRSPLDKDRDWKYYSLPAFLLLSFVMWAMLVVFPSEYTSEYLLYILFWGSMFFTTGYVILLYGPEFVDNPVLTEAHRLTM